MSQVSTGQGPSAPPNHPPQAPDQPQVRFDMLMPPEMADLAARAGLRKVQMDFLSMLMLSMLAGAFIGLAANFSTVIQIGADQLPWGVGKTLAGLAFCLGLILVVIGGAELFTGNNLIVMAVAARKVALRWLIRNWIIVYVGNFIGSMLLVGVVLGTAQHELAGGEVGRLSMQIADSKCALAFWPAFWRGVLCNALVCLAIWLCFSARTTTDRILATVFPITAFVAGGFEHCVANMYFIPMGLLLKNMLGAGGFEALTWRNFLVGNMVPVTIGNIIGGAGFVGLVFWMIYCRRKPKYRKEMK